MRGFLLSLLGLLIGCAGANRGTGEGWRKVSSAHFDVLTPLDSEDARQTALDLERYRAALLARWHRADVQTRRATVVVYPDMATFNAHGAEHFAGFAVASEGLLVEARPSFTEEGLGLAKVITHELAHQIDASVLLRQPRWLNEGLASYLSTATVEDGNARFGRASFEELSAARYLKPVSLEELWGWGQKDIAAMSAEDLQRYYSSSWLWVSYLDNERGDRFDAFLDALKQAKEPRAAFDEAFRGLSAEQMQHELSEFLTRIIPTGTVKMPALDESVTETPASTAQVAITEARVWWFGLGTESKEAKTAFVRQQIALALAAEPSQPDALVMQAEVADDAQRGALARALTEKLPSDPRAWTMLAWDAANHPERHVELLHAVERALATGPGDVEVLQMAAALSKTYEQRLTYAEKAVQLLPFSSNAVALLAHAEAGIGECKQAKTDVERAIDLLPERAPAAVRQRFADALQKAIAGCHSR